MFDLEYNESFSNKNMNWYCWKSIQLEVDMPDLNGAMSDAIGKRKFSSLESLIQIADLKKLRNDFPNATIRLNSTFTMNYVSSGYSSGANIIPMIRVNAGIDIRFYNEPDHVYFKFLRSMEEPKIKKSQAFDPGHTQTLYGYRNFGAVQNQPIHAIHSHINTYIDPTGTWPV